jgi:hypothetical protein
VLGIKTLLATATIALAWTLGTTGELPAQDNHGHRHAGHDHADHDHAEVIAFRLVDWHEQHFEDAQKAALHLQAIQKLGCEVKQARHNGHVDVIYRCTNWKEQTYQTHALAEQWGGWLKGAGFDTHHAHVDEEFLHGDETVQLRLVDWKTAHLTGPQVQASKAFATSLQNVGCAVKNAAHGDHADISYRCPTWVTIHVADHAAAEEWQAWLKGHGFETKHTH